MKKKIASIALAVLIVGLISPGCSTGRINELESQVAMLQTGKTAAEAEAAALQDEKAVVETERDRLKSDLKEKITELNIKDSQVEEISAVLDEKDVEISKLEEEKAELQVEIGCLREPPPEKVSGEIAGYISYKKTVEVGKKLFTRFGVAGSAGYSYPLMSIETLKQFLENDQTNVCPSCRGTDYNAHDGWAFQLKDHWIKNSLSPWSLSLVKVEIDTQYGKILVWRNIFLTKENSEFVFYEVDPCTDEIKKLRNHQKSIGL